MQGTATITGVRSAMKSMAAAYPKNPEKQRALLNRAMRSAASGTILVAAKLAASDGDSSGALAESIGIRTTSKGVMNRSGKVAGIYITPIRYNPKAIALYVAHYKANSTTQVVDGIRHGHLVEFGHATRGGGHVAAKPFLWPAAQSASKPYTRVFASHLKKKIDASVRLAAKKAKLK